MTEKGRIGRLLDSISSPFRRRKTPEPQMPLWTTGIQEPVLVQGITIFSKRYSEEVTIGKRSFTRSVYSAKKNINMM